MEFIRNMYLQNIIFKITIQQMIYNYNTRKKYKHTQNINTVIRTNTFVKLSRV